MAAAFEKPAQEDIPHDRGWDRHDPAARGALQLFDHRGWRGHSVGPGDEPSVVVMAARPSEAADYRAPLYSADRLVECRALRGICSIGEVVLGQSWSVLLRWGFICPIWQRRRCCARGLATTPRKGALKSGESPAPSVGSVPPFGHRLAKGLCAKMDLTRPVKAAALIGPSAATMAGG